MNRQLNLNKHDATTNPISATNTSKQYETQSKTNNNFYKIVVSALENSTILEADTYKMVESGFLDLILTNA